MTQATIAQTLGLTAYPDRPAPDGHTDAARNEDRAATGGPAQVDPDEPADMPAPQHSATYSPEDNKLRIYPAHRLDADTYARVKAAGYSWAPRQELFVAPMWTPAREDLARELCGEIGDEDTSLAERAEERADRFSDYSDKRADDASRAADGTRAISGGIPFGQPILIGHHSQRRAEKDAERIRAGMKRAVDMWDTAQYWTDRAAGAVRAAKYKERADVRARRIKGIEADQRKALKSMEECRTAFRVWDKVPRVEYDRQTALATYISGRLSFGGIGLYSELTAGRIHGDRAWRKAQAHAESEMARLSRWLAHYANRLAYERAMLAEGGGLAADAFDLQPGGIVSWRGRRAAILRVNRKDGAAVSVSVTGQGWTVGVEEITAYEPPSEAAAAAVKVATTKAPLCNYPSEGCATMTAAQWAGIYADTKGTRTVDATETHGAHRRRFVPGYLGEKFGALRGEQWGRTWVFISDAKRTDAPTLGGDPAKPKRKSTARKIADAAGIDTSASTTEADTAPAETCEHLGRTYAVLASFPVGVEGCGPLNAYLAANPGAALLCERAGRYIVATSVDTGCTFKAAKTEARALLADIAAPGPIETAAHVERMQASRAAQAERKTEAAPFEAIRQALKTGQAVQVVSAPQLFPTPAHVAARMVDLAGLTEGARVLEPSAGTGALLRAVREARTAAAGQMDVTRQAVEINPQLCDRLRNGAEAGANVWPGDFLALQPCEFAQSFDVVLMNPPFKDAADVAHILHARRFLAPGGRLVAICAAGPRQHDALQGLADSWEYLPPGTFEGTNVRTVLLTMGAAS